jgi:exosortase A
VYINKKYFPIVILIVIYSAIALAQLPIIENIWLYSFDDGSYSHAYLIPIICIYMYWLLFTTGELEFNNKINMISIIITISLAYLLFVFSLAQIPTGYRILLILFIAAITGLIFKPTLRVLFPAIFLIFLVPVWGILTPFLQQLSTQSVTFIMGYSGIPTYVEGNMITIPPGIFEIADGCSGLRYLLVSLAISSLFIFLNIRKASHGAIFLTVAIIGALITNWLRITGLILIGYFTDMESSLMTDHNTFGWYLYIPFMMGLFYFGQRYVVQNENVSKKTPSSNIFPAGTLAIALLIILTSSNFTKQQLTTFPVASESKCVDISNDIPQPQLHHVIRSCAKVKGDVIAIQYDFDSAQLESSVDYYLNDFTAKNWQVVYKHQGELWNTLQLKQEMKYFTINYKYLVGSKSTVNLSYLKKLKLMEALKGESGTSLIWTISKK